MKLPILGSVLLVSGGLATVVLQFFLPPAIAALRWTSVIQLLPVLIAITGLLIVLTGRGNKAALRIDWFLPYLRKKKSKQSLPPSSWLLRVARSYLPQRLFADPV